MRLIYMTCIRSTVGEYCDDWIMVGKRCDNDHKVIIGTTNNGWGDLSPSILTSNDGKMITTLGRKNNEW